MVLLPNFSFGVTHLSAFEVSPILLFSLLGIWGAIFLLRNYYSGAPFYTIRARRFYKVHAPRWFLAFTVFYMAIALLFIAIPIYIFIGLLNS